MLTWWRLFPLAGFLLWLPVTVSPAPAGSEGGQRVRIPFSAGLFRYNKELPQKVVRARVMYGREGIRRESAGHGQGPRAVAILNFKQRKAWFVAPEREIYVEAPGADQPGVETGDMRQGVLSAVPCQAHGEGRRTGSRTHAGRRVEVWSCSGTGAGGQVLQYYDPELGLVVRQETADGHVEELREIRTGEQDSALFAPPRDFRKTSLRELFTGIVELPVYVEPRGEGGGESQTGPESDR